MPTKSKFKKWRVVTEFDAYYKLLEVLIRAKNWFQSLAIELVEHDQYYGFSSKGPWFQLKDRVTLAEMLVGALNEDGIRIWLTPSLKPEPSLRELSVPFQFGAELELIRLNQKNKRHWVLEMKKPHKSRSSKKHFHYERIKGSTL